MLKADNYKRLMITTKQNLHIYTYIYMAEYITCPVRRSEFVYNGNTTKNVLVSMASLQAVISYKW